MELKRKLFSLIIFIFVSHVKSLSQRDLLLGYDKETSSNASACVTIEFFLQHLMYFDPKWGIHLSGIFILQWMDDRLTWNDSDSKYEATEISININKIWTPSLVLSNSMNGLKIDGQSENRRDEQVNVSMKGHVTWMTHANLDPYCPTDNRFGNRQFCQLVMGASYGKTKRFDFKLNSDTFDLKANVDNHNLKLCGTRSMLNKDAFGNSIVHFKFWFRPLTTTAGYVYFSARALLVASISSCSVFVFKMPADAGRIEFISIMLIVTNLVDPSTLDIAFHEVIYYVLIFSYVLTGVCLIVVVLRVVIIPYDRILSVCSKCICCRHRNAKTLTKRKNTLKTRVSSKLLTVRQARKSFHEKEDINDETEGASVEMSTTHANENRETDLLEQLDNEQAENDFYDRRNFRLFVGVYIFEFFVAMVYSVGSGMSISACEFEDVFNIDQGYYDIT